MEVLYKRCCGIDIHKNMMVACVFTSVRKKEIRQFSTMTEDILQLVSWLKETNCEMAAMESSRMCSCCHTKQTKLSLFPLSKNCRTQRWKKGFNRSSPYHVNRDLSHTKRESSLSRPWSGLLLRYQSRKDNQQEYSFIRKVRGKCNYSAEMNLFNRIIKRKK